ncbi:unnamed protein product, partial [Oppiella nova]
MNVVINSRFKDDVFYLDHAVDGNPLFPATGYLLLAWRQLAAYAGKLWYKVPVIFENVQLKRATFLTDNKDTRLTVRYFPLTGRRIQTKQNDFGIYENDNLCCVGKIRAPGDDVLVAQHKIYENETNLSKCEYILERDDIYKELRILGLDYGPEFRRLLKVGTNDYKNFYALNEWTGNWVTYMDAVLQSMALALPFLNTLLENEMDKFKERFAIYPANMPLYFNMDTKHLVAQGIEVEQVLAFPIPRRVDTVDLVLDSAEFCANDDPAAIDESMKASIMKYLESISDEVIEEYRNANNENHVMFRILDKMLSEVSDNNNKQKIDNNKDMKTLLNDILVNPDYDLSRDLINQISSNERMIRSLVDIVCENFVTINLQTFLQDLYDSIQSNGFLLTVFRYKFTEPEIALNSLNGKTCLNNDDLDSRIDNVQWFGVLQEKLIAAKDADNKTDNVWLIANDSSINGIIDVNPFLVDFPVIQTKLFLNFCPYSDILANDLVANVVKEGKVGTYRHLRLPTDYDKCLSNGYHLNLGQTRDLSGLQWFDSRKIPEIQEQFGLDNRKVNQKRVDIYYSGLTFRDVMLSTGRIPGGPEQLITDCSIGCEFAGRRADTGERVMGLAMSKAISTSINANIDSMTTVPKQWSMAEAVTILSTYSTLWYGLIKRANIKRGESILVHSAAGGVGQSAINMCLHYGCDIYVTVGTEEKKQFLVKEYNIPVNRIFNSRD